MRNPQPKKKLFTMEKMKAKMVTTKLASRPTPPVSCKKVRSGIRHRITKARFTRHVDHAFETDKTIKDAA